MKARYKECRHNGKKMRLHVAIYLVYNNLTKVPEGYVIHHKNLNRFDNDIENLICITKKEHDKIHASLRKRNKKGRFV